MLVAFSPWSFILSRFGFESNLGLLFWTMSLALLYSVSKKSGAALLILTGATLAATWYSYIAYRPISVLILIGFSIFWYFTKSLPIKSMFIIWIVFIVSVAPFLNPDNSTVNTARFEQIGILSDPGVTMTIDENRTFCAFTAPRLVCDIAWNKISVLAPTLAGRFFSTYSPQYLAFLGNSNTYLSVGGFGQLPWIVYPAFLLGLSRVLFGKLKRKTVFFLILGIIIAPLPAILAGEPQKVRLSAALPFIIMLTGLGAELFWENLKNMAGQFKPKFSLWMIGSIIAGIFFFTIFQFFSSFYVIHSQKNDFAYSSFSRKISSFIQLQSPDTRIYIRGMYSDPVMMHAFYSKMNPFTYQNTAVLGELEESGFQHTISVDNFYIASESFEQLACQALTANQPTIVISDEDVSGVPLLPTHVLARFNSENGVYQYAAAYDALAYAQSNPAACLQPNP